MTTGGSKAYGARSLEKHPTVDDRRVRALDSVRGIASLVVVANHAVLAIPGFDDLVWADPNAERTFSFDWRHALTYSPLHVFWAGHEAVTVFFVLSGFVLTMSILSRPEKYVFYAIRRFARIWLPFCASILLAALSSILALQIAHPQGLSPWILSVLYVPHDLGQIFVQLLMGGLKGEMSLNPVMWSLVHELRISFLMPVIIYLARRHRYILLAVCCACLAPGLAGANVYSLSAYSLQGSFAQTANYIPLFAMGSLLALHHKSIGDRIARLGRAPTMMLFATSFLLLLCKWLFTDKAFVIHVANALGASLLIALAFGVSRVRSKLEHSAFLWFGKISYSLYLTHLPLLALTLAAFSTFLPLPISIVVATMVVIAAASLFYVLVERPVHGFASGLFRSNSRQAAGALRSSPR